MWRWRTSSPSVPYAGSMLEPIGKISKAADAQTAHQPRQDQHTDISAGRAHAALIFSSPSPLGASGPVTGEAVAMCSWGEEDKNLHETQRIPSITTTVTLRHFGFYFKFCFYLRNWYTQLGAQTRNYPRSRVPCFSHSASQPPPALRLFLSYFCKPILLISGVFISSTVIKLINLGSHTGTYSFMSCCQRAWGEIKQDCIGRGWEETSL